MFILLYFSLICTYIESIPKLKLNEHSDNNTENILPLNYIKLLSSVQLPLNNSILELQTLIDEEVTIISVTFAFAKIFHILLPSINIPVIETNFFNVDPMRGKIRHTKVIMNSSSLKVLNMSELRNKVNLFSTLISTLWTTETKISNYFSFKNFKSLVKDIPVIQSKFDIVNNNIFKSKSTRESNEESKLSDSTGDKLPLTDRNLDNYEDDYISKFERAFTDINNSLVIKLFFLENFIIRMLKNKLDTAFTIFKDNYICHGM